MSPLRPIEWNGFSKFLHWTVAVLIIAIALIGLTHDAFPTDTKRTIMGLHKAMGATVLILMIVRLIWNLLTPSPGKNQVTPAWQYMTAKLVHFGIYVGVIGQALIGWAMSSASGRPVSFFGLFDLPALVAQSESTADLMHELHETVFWLLALFIVVHIAAAIYHQVVMKDNLLARIWPGKNRPLA